MKKEFPYQIIFLGFQTYEKVIFHSQLGYNTTQVGLKPGNETTRLNILWHHLMVYKGKDHIKLLSICSIYTMNYRIIILITPRRICHWKMQSYNQYCSLLLEFPLPVVKWTNLTSLQPARDAVKVESMLLRDSKDSHLGFYLPQEEQRSIQARLVTQFGSCLLLVVAVSF